MVSSSTIIIINPPNPPHSVSNKDTMGAMGQLYPSSTNVKVPPIDIPYIAAVLRKENIPFKIIDCLGSDLGLDELMLQLQEGVDTLVAIRTSTPTFDWDMRIAKIVKEWTYSKIIVFGPHVMLSPEETLKQPFVDAVVVSKPESVFLELAKRGEFKECDGLWYKQKDSIVRNKTKEPIDDLDNLPFPAWDILPYQNYNRGALTRNNKPFVTVLASRGCPHSCIYCPYPVIQGRIFRTRSPANIVDELEWLTKELGVKAVLFRDPEFALVRERVIEICNGILARKLKVCWRCETRIQDLDEELIVLMRRTGCMGVYVGIESTDEEVLKIIKRKSISLNRMTKIINICKKNGLDIFCFFILGLPGETKRAALRTIEYASKLNPTFIQFTAATPYPGTGLRKWAESRGFIENKSLSTMTGYEVNMRNEYMTSDEIRTLRWLANETCRMRWDKIVRRILKHGLRATSEVGKWLTFQKVKLKFKASRLRRDY